MLNDASEVRFADFTQYDQYPTAPRDALTLQLPIHQPDVLVPVVELFLK